MSLKKHLDYFAGETSISHDKKGLTPLPDHGYGSPGSYRVQIAYDEASIQQLQALTEISESCQQYISYECYNALIFDWNSLVYTWWVSVHGEKMTNWGSPTGTEGCHCMPSMSSIFSE